MRTRQLMDKITDTGWRVTTDKVLLEQMCAIVAFHFKLLGCNGKCDRLHLCQRRCMKLLNSRDAWAPLWEAMTDEQWEVFLEHLCNTSGTTLESVDDGTISLEEFARMILLAPKPAILEACLRMLGKWTPEMGEMNILTSDPLITEAAEAYLLSLAIEEKKK